MNETSSSFSRVARAELPTKHGSFTIYGFETSDGEEIVALVSGELVPEKAPLVRIHSQCLTGDVFGSLRCDCGEQLGRALEMIAQSGGMLIYDPQEGRGIGLMNKLLAYELQDAGADTVDANRELGFEADERSYRLCAEVLRFFGIKEVRLLSNNPQKIAELKGYGITVVERVALEVAPSPLTAGYLKAKKEKLGHLLEGI